MRIRRDSVFVASVLFTIALVCLIPWYWHDALAGRDVRSLESLDAGFQLAEREAGDFGVASLVIILIGLIVTWKGYVNKVRWTWFVMFTIAWVWAFPLLVLPLLTHEISCTFAESLYDAMHQAGPPREWTESVLIFLLMVIALVLPIKSFFLVREISEPTKLSPMLIGVSAVSVLIILIALLAWVQFSAYEIPPAVLRMEQQLPPPPPPPQSPSKAQ